MNYFPTKLLCKKKTILAILERKPKPGIIIKHIPIPKPKHGEVLVKVIYASICGTDIGIYDWIPWAAGHIKPPIVFGHELVGKVIEINNNVIASLPNQQAKQSRRDRHACPERSRGIADAPRDDIVKPGDLVSSETHIFCLNCYQCKIKNYHVCENMSLFGIGRNGCFAEYATIPIRTTWRNDLSIPVKSMSVQEPLGNAVNVVTKANVKNKKVLIMELSRPIHRYGGKSIWRPRNCRC